MVSADRCPSPEIASRWRRALSSAASSRWILPLLGLLSLIWFLIRVIPKPSRATYPCQQAAFPIASGFVVWAVGFATSVALFRHTRKKLHQARYAIATLSLVAAVGVLALTFVNGPSASAIADDHPPFVPSEGANLPMGEPFGIHPGRVAWVHDPAATPWDGSGLWWEDGNTDEFVVGRMVSQSLRTLTGEAGDAAAWEALFRDFNARHGKGEVGYRAGERIAVKLNLNQIVEVSEIDDRVNRALTGPQFALALLRQLVHVAGVHEADIALYDATRHAPEWLVDPVREEFSGVRFVEWLGAPANREVSVRDTDVLVDWSAELTLETGGGNPTYLPTVVTEAEYLINVANLKGHGLPGVTLCAKNHFGTILADFEGEPVHYSPKGAGIHPYIAVHDFAVGSADWESLERDMGTYNALVDIMGHEHLGDKTLLFVIDALYATQDAGLEIDEDRKWVMAPFDGHWTSSVFMSQDGVAIESVAVDFMRAEPTNFTVYGNVDNYLHEAALANDPPSGTVYDPEGDGTRLRSLGVHEHWNNPVDRQYSGNLGRAGGIELVTPQMMTAVEGETAAPVPNALSLRNYPNPFNASTVLSFAITDDGPAQVHLYDALGQPVALLMDRSIRAGRHEVVWDGTDNRGQEVASGVYLAKLITEGTAITRKLLLLQ